MLIPLRSLCLAVCLPVAVAACGGGEEATTEGPAIPATPPAPIPPPVPVRQPLSGDPVPALLVTQATFWKNELGKSKPGPARLSIWRQTATGWSETRVEDADSNVFHKAIQLKDGSIITAAAEKAMLKRWTFADGKWSSELLWSKEWGGQFNRLRDLEIADVDGDGKDEYVIATHDHGVVAVFNPDAPGGGVVELSSRPDTFVHEIEIGDVMGDKKKEFFATPSGRNEANKSQSGGVVMYKWNGKEYVSSEVEPWGASHAKEILVTDLNKDGKDDLLAVMEATTDATGNITHPVEIRRYIPDAKGGFTSTILASINDRQTRFLVPGDFDGDGQMDLVAAAMTTGLWLLKADPAAKDGPWKATSIDSNSSGFEHACRAADLDGDGKLELYVVADDQGEFKRYVWNASSSSFDKVVLGKTSKEDITWNVEPARL